MTTASLARTSSRLLVLFVTIAACAPVAKQVTPPPSSVPSALPSVVASSSPTASAPGTAAQSVVPSATDTNSASAGDFEFVHWLSRGVELKLAPGSDVITATTNDEPIAAVLDRRVVGGMEWIKVEVGRGYAQDYVATGWAPHAADVVEGSKTTHVDPVYEPMVPDCPAHPPTILDLDGMLPLQALYCFGGGEMKLSPVIVRYEGSEESEIVFGTPEWLAVGGDLAAYWLPEWAEYGSIRLHIDPRLGMEIGDGEWVEITGHLDDPAAQTCARTSDFDEFKLPDPEDAVPLCRGRFVATGFRRLTEAEIPPKPATQTPGPPAETSAEVAVREFHPPIKNRAGAAAVWTGLEMVVWGGFDVDRDNESALDDGGAYAPASGDWRGISSGPLSARAYSESVWTGTEMLVWGGQRNYRVELSDGAAFDPVTDSWRALAAAPIKWDHTNASIWTGTEWWIAVEHGGRVDVAAYDPAANTWRSMPSVSEDDFDSLGLAWTGSEVLMKTVRGLYRTDAHGSEWTFIEVDFSGPITWADGLLYGSGFDNASSEPLGWDPFYHPVAWDPTTSTERPMAAAPHSAYDYAGGVWTGRYLAFFEDDLAYDPAVDAWLRLKTPRDPNVLGWDSVLDNNGTAQVWTGDRLVVWGGTDECAFMTGNVATGYELIPAWPTATTGAVFGRQSASQSSGSGGGSVALAC